MSQSGRPEGHGGHSASKGTAKTPVKPLSRKPAVSPEQENVHFPERLTKPNRAVCVPMGRLCGTRTPLKKPMCEPLHQHRIPPGGVRASGPPAGDQERVVPRGGTLAPRNTALVQAAGVFSINSNKSLLSQTMFLHPKGMS